MLLIASMSKSYAHCTGLHPHHCVKETIDNVDKTVKKAGRDINRTVIKAGKDTEATVNKAGKDINRTVIKAGKDAERTINKAGKDINRTAIKAGKEGENFVQDIDTWIKTGDCGGDICDTLAKAVEDTVDESERAAENIEDAGQAIGHFVENEAHSIGDTIADADKRIREGKVIDAIWHLATDPAQHTSDNAGKMAQESKLIASAGQIVATAYGGPGGAAAYATWLTYQQTCAQGTCNPELALRVGIITGATSLAMSAAGELPIETTGQVLKKAAVAGAIGGLAIAVSGGDEDAVRKGFMLSAGAVLLRDGYKVVTSKEFDARAPTKGPYCMSTANPGLDCAPKAAYLRDADGGVIFKDGKPVISDIRPLDADRVRTGNWGTEKDTGLGSLNKETGPVMKHIAKIPVIHPMSIFHDQWSFDVNMDPITNVATIVPAAVLTYVATGAPAYDLIQSTNLKSNKVVNHNNFRTVYKNIEKDDQNVIPFSSGVAAMSTLCIHGKKSRRIVVDAPSAEPGYACRVIYQNERGTSVPWYARNEENYCREKAVALTVKQIALGWSCYVQ